MSYWHLKFFAVVVGKSFWESSFISHLIYHSTQNFKASSMMYKSLSNIQSVKNYCAKTISKNVFFSVFCVFIDVDVEGWAGFFYILGNLKTWRIQRYQNHWKKIYLQAVSEGSNIACRFAMCFLTKTLPIWFRSVKFDTGTSWFLPKMQKKIIDRKPR